jgi:hypothetical protein
LVGFWQAVYKDAKYIKRESFGPAEPDPYPATIHNLQRNSEAYPYNSVGYTSTIHAQQNSQTWHATSAHTTVFVASSNTSKQQLRTPSQRTSAQRSSSLVALNMDQQLNSCLRKRQLLLILIVSY